MMIIQLGILTLGPFYYAQSSGDANQQASSCGSGAGSCSSVALNEASTTDSSVEGGTELDAGFPIDIPAPIAKAESGVDPSSLRFTSAPNSLISNFQLRALETPHAATSVIAGTLYGAVIDADSLTLEKNVGLIINGVFRETATTSDGNFQFIIYEHEIEIDLALVVFGENSTADNGGDISAPVITKVRLDPNDSYLLEVSITNVDSETAENGGNIQSLPITFSNDGDDIIFNAIDDDDSSFLGEVPIVGGLHEILATSDSFISKLGAPNPNLDVSLIGLHDVSLDLCSMSNNTLSCFDESFNSTESRALSISPNGNYLAIQSTSDNNIDIYSLDDLSTKLGTITTPNNESLANSIEITWTSNTSLFIIKEINNNFVGQIVSDLSEVISGNSTSLDPEDSFVHSEIITSPRSLQDQNQTVFVKCDNGSGIYEICEIILSEDSPSVNLYLESENNINNFVISSSGDYLILEVYDEENYLAVYGTNTSDDNLVYIGYGSHPAISNFNTNLIAYIANQQIGLINLENFTLEFTPRSNDDDEPISPPANPEVIDTTPADAATDISLDADIEISFDLSMDTTSTQSALSISSGNTNYSGSYSWNGDSTELTFSSDSNFIHDTIYSVNLSTNAESEEEASLSEALSTSFTTRSFRSETIITGDVNTNASVQGRQAFAVDGENLHFIFKNEIDNNILYTTCNSNCNDSANWSDPAIIYNSGLSGPSTLEVGNNGELHYLLDENLDLIYMTCSNNCTNGGNWSSGSLGSQGGGEAKNDLRVDSQNSLHSVRFSNGVDDNPGDLIYTSCSENCTNPANWAKTSVYNSFALGTKYTFYIDENDYKYIVVRDDAANGPVLGICTENDCHDENNWNFVTIDNELVNNDMAISISPNNRIHVAYQLNGDFNIKYATCLNNCTQAENWTSLNISTNGEFAFDHVELETISNNAIMILSSETDNTNSQASYFVCHNGCDNINNWDKQDILQGLDGVGYYPNMDLGDNDKVHIMSIGKNGPADNFVDFIYLD